VTYHSSAMRLFARVTVYFTYVIVIFMAGDRPKYNRDGTFYLIYTTHSLSEFCATRSIPII